MSAPIQVPMAMPQVREVRECERCYLEADDDELLLVMHPESYGIAGSPDTFELVCAACLRREAESDDLPF
jgi:hypothetical protein